MEKSIVVMDAPDGARGIEDIGEENPYFLGAFGEVIGALRALLPNGDFSDPTHITSSVGAGALRVEIAKHTPVQSFMVYYEGEEALRLMQELCKKTGWRILDTDTGQFVDQKTLAGSTKASGTKKRGWQFWRK